MKLMLFSGEREILMPRALGRIYEPIDYLEDVFQFRSHTTERVPSHRHDHVRVRVHGRDRDHVRVHRGRV